MKNKLCITLLFSLTLLVFTLGIKASIPPAFTPAYQLETGDIVFQESNDGQAIAVKAATGSRWSHTGIIFFRNNTPYVLEAIQPVTITSLERFAARSRGEIYALRLKDKSKINHATLNKAVEFSNTHMGKNYDRKFLWSDDNMYCSELVWKLYKEAFGIELCKPRTFGSYDVDHHKVRSLIKQRFGDESLFPLDELAVAPSDIAQSNLLIEVPINK